VGFGGRVVSRGWGGGEENGGVGGGRVNSEWVWWGWGVGGRGNNYVNIERGAVRG